MLTLPKLQTSYNATFTRTEKGGVISWTAGTGREMKFGVTGWACQQLGWEASFAYTGKTVKCAKHMSGNEQFAASLMILSVPCPEGVNPDLFAYLMSIMDVSGHKDMISEEIRNQEFFKLAVAQGII